MTNINNTSDYNYLLVILVMTRIINVKDNLVMLTITSVISTNN